MRKLISLVLVLLACAIPGRAAAAISDDLSEDLKEYVDEAIDADNLTAQRGALLTWGYIADGDQREEIAEYKTSDIFGVRLAAGLALMTAGDDEAETFVIEQLKGESNLFPILRNQLSVLPDDREGELVRTLIEQGEPAQKRAAFRYLATRHGSLYDLLGDYVSSSDEKVRNGALAAVRSTARKEALEFVESRMLSSDDEAIQKAGIDLAVHVSQFPGRTQRSIEVLKGAVDHDNAAVAQKAGIRLLEMHDKGGVERLVSLLGELEDKNARIAIADALLTHDIAPPSDKVEKLYGKTEDEALKQSFLELWVASGDEKAFEKVVEMFGSTHFDKRLKAAKAFGHTDEKAAVQKLGKGLFEGSSKMRLAAARSLRQIGDTEALPFLKRAISKERNTEVKVEVIGAIGAIGTEDAMRILRFNSRTRLPEIKKAIIAAVRTAGQKDGAKTLNLFFGARDTEIQWKAFVAALDVAPDVAMKRVEQAFRNPPDNFMNDLGELPIDRQKRILKSLLAHENDRVRGAALRHAERIGTPLFAMFRKYVADDGTSKDVRTGMLRSLAAAKEAKDAPLLEKLVREGGDEDIVQLAAWSLADYASEDSEATFRGYLTGDDLGLKVIGAYGLARIKS